MEDGKVSGTNWKAEPVEGPVDEAVFRDPEIWEPFRNAPAAKMMHHAYCGGLLEHSLSLARLVQLALKNYPFLNRDLLLTAALVVGRGYTPEARARREALHAHKRVRKTQPVSSLRRGRAEASRET